VRRRAAGEPVASLTGRRAFWSLEVEVTAAVLIPGHETELLVERALDLLAVGRPARVADLGTGSGAIAFALASERPRWTVVAPDASTDALAVARGNATRLGLTRIDFRPGSWTEALAPGETYEALISNTPYVADDDPHLAQGDLRYEPRTALVAGPDGLAAIRALVPAALPHLAPGGWLLLEHGAEQGSAVREVLRGAGLDAVRTVQDLAGLDRVSLGCRPALA
jgi:release factor glutamine methyltransferase